MKFCRSFTAFTIPYHLPVQVYVHGTAYRSKMQVHFFIFPVFRSFKMTLITTNGINIVRYKWRILWKRIYHIRIYGRTVTFQFPIRRNLYLVPPRGIIIRFIKRYRSFRYTCRVIKTPFSI